jgi:hypothetical protein
MGVAEIYEPSDGRVHWNLGYLLRGYSIDHLVRILGRPSSWSEKLIIASAFYALHREEYPSLDAIATDTFAKPSLDSICVLQAMTRIVIDISYAFNEHFSEFNMAAISPSYPFIVYKAAMELLLADEVGGDGWMKDFCTLRTCCWYFSHRWTVASTSPTGPWIFPVDGPDSSVRYLGTYLETLEQTAKATKADPLPPLGEFISPVGVRSGLC